jgi:hypothetical protein
MVKSRREQIANTPISANFAQGIVLDEQSAGFGAGHVASNKGIIWVDSTTIPNSLMFTDESGTDHALGGTQTLAETLVFGNSTGTDGYTSGNSIKLSSGDSLITALGHLPGDPGIALNITAGNGNGSGAGGAISLKSGDGSNVLALGGNVSISPVAATSGGSISMIAGDSLVGNAGRLYLQYGSGAGGANEDGHFLLVGTPIHQGNATSILSINPEGPNTYSESSVLGTLSSVLFFQYAGNDMNGALIHQRFPTADSSGGPTIYAGQQSNFGLPIGLVGGLGAEGGGESFIEGGQCNSVGFGGDAGVFGGTPVDGYGGNVIITGGPAAGLNNGGGNIIITPGSNTGSGPQGVMYIVGAGATIVFDEMTANIHSNMSASGNIWIRNNTHQTLMLTNDEGVDLAVTWTYPSTNPIIANHTSINGERVWYNPSGGTFTLKAPSSPALGHKWACKNATTDITSITIDGNGVNIENPVAGSIGATFGLAVALVSIEWEFNGTNWLAV